MNHIEYTASQAFLILVALVLLVTGFLLRPKIYNEVTVLCGIREKLLPLVLALFSFLLPQVVANEFHSVSTPIVLLFIAATTVNVMTFLECLLEIRLDHHLKNSTTTESAKPPH